MSPAPVSPRKSLGQNFLQDPNTIRKIVSSIEAGPEAHVVEIGPGMGALTGELLAHFPQLTAIEIDSRAVEYLREVHPALDVRQVDVMDVDWAALSAEKPGPVHVVGNLPYYLTSPILIMLLDNRRLIREAVVMMQLEVAERLVAPHGTKEYGILSVYTQLYSRAELLFKVSRNVFFPKPDVTSAVVRLRFDQPHPRAGEMPDEQLRQVVRAAFNQRRKTLHNSLSRWTRERGITLPESMAGRRAESLAPEEFVDLTRYLYGSLQD